MLSPWTWEEILEKFPLSYAKGRHVIHIPDGRVVRDLDDKAAQYGDVLQYGDTFVRLPGNVFFVQVSGTAGTSSYTMAALTTSGKSTYTYSPSMTTQGECG